MIIHAHCPTKRVEDKRAGLPQGQKRGTSRGDCERGREKSPSTPPLRQPDGLKRVG